MTVYCLLFAALDSRGEHCSNYKMLFGRVGKTLPTYQGYVGRNCRWNNWKIVLVRTKFSNLMVVWNLKHLRYHKVRNVVFLPYIIRTVIFFATVWKYLIWTGYFKFPNGNSSLILSTFKKIVDIKLECICYFNCSNNS